MKRLSFLAFVLSLLSMTARADERETKERLTYHLERVESSARSARYWGGGAFLVLGAASIAGAVVASGSSNPQVQKTGPLSLGLAGGAFALSGALILALPSEFETEPKQYRILPEQTPEQIRYKIARGESMLSDLSDRARHRRMLSGWLLVGGGAAMVGLYAINSSSERDILLYEGAFFGGLGAATLLIKRGIETEFDEFRNWQEAKSVKTSSLQWSVLPTLSGVSATLHYQF